MGYLASLIFVTFLFRSIYCQVDNNTNSMGAGSEESSPDLPDNSPQSSQLPNSNTSSSGSDNSMGNRPQCYIKCQEIPGDLQGSRGSGQGQINVDNTGEGYEEEEGPDGMVVHVPVPVDSPAGPFAFGGPGPFFGGPGPWFRGKREVSRDMMHRATDGKFFKCAKVCQ